MLITTLIRSMRPAFLLLPPVCIYLGASYAHYRGVAIDTALLIIILLGATLAHISVNMLNEYQDFTSGLDLHTRKTPFSGGSGALPDNPAMAGYVLYASMASFTATIVAGLYIVYLQGPAIMPIGILGLLIILSYTTWLNRLPLICLLSPGTGFGFFMVGGTVLILAGHIDTAIWSVALCPFFLLNNLLLLNQLPDIDADRAAGRRHFPIAYGVSASVLVYGLFTLAAYTTVVIAVLWNLLPMLSLSVLITLPVALYAYAGACRHGKHIGSHPHYLAANVISSLLTPALLGTSLILV